MGLPSRPKLGLLGQTKTGNPMAEDAPDPGPDPSNGGLLLSLGVAMDEDPAPVAAGGEESPDPSPPLRLPREALRAVVGGKELLVGPPIIGPRAKAPNALPRVPLVPMGPPLGPKTPPLDPMGPPLAVMLDVGGPGEEPDEGA